MLNYENLLIKLTELEDVLSEYEEATNLLSVADFENSTEVNSIIATREKLIEKSRPITAAISEELDKDENEQSDLIRKMLRGENFFADLSNSEKSVYSKIISIRSLQNNILKWDKSGNDRFKIKYSEIKSTLMDLNENKKKIDYYNKATFGGKGIELNSNG